MTYTAQQKLEAVRREIKMRMKVYPRWIDDGRMSKDKAAHEIAVMESIAADYEAMVGSERLI